MLKTPQRTNQASRAPQWTSRACCRNGRVLSAAAWLATTISSSEPEGLCFIETSNLGGETNLKIKQASPHTASLTAPHLVTALRGSLRSEHPDNSLYTYEGTLDLTTARGFPMQVPLSPDQMLLRGAQIRDTLWAYGFVVFTGHETKLMRNAT